MKKYFPLDDVDREKIQNSIRFKVTVGEDAKINIGGMRQSVVNVVERKQHGIVVQDEDSNKFWIAWRHVIGPAGKQKAKPKTGENMTKSDQTEMRRALEKRAKPRRKKMVVFYPDSDFMLKSAIPTKKRQENNPLPSEIKFDSWGVIPTPEEYRDDPDIWIYALHEVGHGIIGNILGLKCAGVSVHKDDCGVGGICYTGGRADDGKIAIDVAGIAAEILSDQEVKFDTSWADYQYAAEELAAKGYTDDREIMQTIKETTVAVARELRRKFVPSLIKIAHEVIRRGWVSGLQFGELMGDAQLLAKSLQAPDNEIHKWEDFRPTKLHALTESIEALTKSLPPAPTIAENVFNRATQILNDSEGMTAQEIATAENIRNRAASQMAEADV